MGIADWLFPSRNRTAAWRDDGRTLVLDLDAHRLSGAGIGDRFDRLDFLGPGRRDGTAYGFPAHGLLIDVDESDRIDAFTIFLGTFAEPRTGRFDGEIVACGAAWPRTATIHECDWLEHFGEPYWRDVDVDETIHFHEWGANGEPETEWQAEFDLDRCLACLVITPPLLADAEQRRAYGIGKPWPPVSPPPP